MAAAKSVNETTFAKTVLAATTPVLVLFGSRSCAASRVFGELLAPFSNRTNACIDAVRVDVERSALLAEQYGVVSTPTLMLFDAGEVVTRVVGFVSPGLLHALVDQVCRDALPREAYWRPLEALVEDTVILPLLGDAGLWGDRQVACKIAKDGAQRRGRIDVLVRRKADAPPFTLIESKRLLRTKGDLQQAAAQALSYAQALGLPSCIVAAPSGLWLFRRDGAHLMLEQTLSSLDTFCTPHLVASALERLERYILA